MVSGFIGSLRAHLGTRATRVLSYSLWVSMMPAARPVARLPTPTSSLHPSDVERKRVDHRDLSSSFVVRRAITQWRFRLNEWIISPLRPDGVPVFPLAPRSKFPLISAANDGHE